MPTKTKKKLLRSECVSPPREIREVTKERRAWLANMLAQINALPNREAKIVGTGSYQSISVYEVTEQEGRLRLRGNCQFCGCSQVVQGEALVLHGYKRPGDGYVLGQCPGMNLKPLQLEKSATEKWLDDAKLSLETAKELKAIAETEKVNATQAWRNSEEYKIEDSWRRPTHTKLQREITERDEEDLKQAIAEWKTKYPLTVARQKADREYEKTRQTVWLAESGVRHFQMLLDFNFTGKPLDEEIVV